MHVDNENFSRKLTDVELAHTKECEQCCAELTLLQSLSKSAEQMEVMTPDANLWARIERSRTAATQQNPVHWSQKVIGVAAAVMLCATGWLIWNNYSLQQQLEHILVVNQSLELTLMQQSAPTFSQSRLLLEVHAIEQKLLQAKDTEAKLLLLKERQRLMQQMITVEKRDEHEISI